MLFITYIKCILSITIMSSNRVQYFIRSILQNSKLNREKFVNNKKKYNMTTVKNRNHNIIIKRNFGSSSGFIPPNSNGPNKDPDYFKTAVVALIVGTYIVTNRRK
jgi:hypothetical protein